MPAYTLGMRTDSFPRFAAAGLLLAAGWAFAGLPAEGAGMAFTLSSSAFQDHGPMPKRYSCEGGDTSPVLAWSGAPAGTKSYALIMDDPDAPDPAAPKMTWVHWVVYDIPAAVTGLAEGASTHMPAGSKDGVSSFEKTGYGGPCPPIGRHRYFHKLYALDTVLPDLGATDKDKLLAAMQGHVLAEADLVGTYQKGDR